MNEITSLSDPILSESTLRPSQLAARNLIRPLTLATYAAVLASLTHANLHGTVLDQANYHDPFSIIDKVFHFGSYAVFAGLALILFESSSRVRAESSDRTWMMIRNAVGWSLLIACLGAIDEITQPYFGRRCDVLDWLANAAGIVTASSIYLLVRRRELFSFRAVDR